MCTISRVRPIWRRNSSPSPAPWCARFFHEARQIGHDEAPITRHLHDAQLRFQRGEGVVGDLWLCGAISRLKSVLLPALGMPTKPTSAMSFSSSRKWRTCGSPPGSA